jgi:hypothetical protein
MCILLFFQHSISICTSYGCVRVHVTAIKLYVNAYCVSVTFHLLTAESYKTSLKTMKYLPSETHDFLLQFVVSAFRPVSTSYPHPILSEVYLGHVVLSVYTAACFSILSSAILSKFFIRHCLCSPILFCTDCVLTVYLF